MAKKFKDEFKNSVVTVRTPASGRIQIDCSKADANKWAIIPELQFMIEDCEEKEVEREAEVIPPNPDALKFSDDVDLENKPFPLNMNPADGLVLVSEENKDEEPLPTTVDPKGLNLNYEDYSLKELREMFPKIKATSKAKFIELIQSLM